MYANIARSGYEARHQPNRNLLLGCDSVVDALVQLRPEVPAYSAETWQGERERERIREGEGERMAERE